MTINQYDDNGTHQSTTSPFFPILVQHPPDDAFIESWLHGKSKLTRKTYALIAKRLRAFIHPKNLKEVELVTLQTFLSELKGADETKRLASTTIKALYSFGHKSGYLSANLGSLLPALKYQFKLTERYLTEEEVMRMVVALQGRDKVILKILYSVGLRVSELAGLSWKDVQARESGEGQLTVLGKGNKIRTVILSRGTFQDLLQIKPSEVSENDPVLVTRENSRMAVRTIQALVENTARRVGITKRVSAHWLRHAHASHALDRGAPIHLVQVTLGHSNIATTARYLHARPNESSSKYLGI